MEIDIDDYLTYEDKRRIAQEEFTRLCRGVMCNEGEVKRIISNGSYDVVYKMVDSTLNEKLEQLLTDKVVSLIGGLSTYHLFKQPDAWDRDTNTAYDILKAAVIENRHVIKALVDSNIQSQALEVLKAECYNVVKEAICEHFENIGGKNGS